MEDSVLPMDRIAAIQETLIGFIMDEVVNPNGEFYYDGRPLAQLNANPSS